MTNEIDTEWIILWLLITKQAQIEFVKTQFIVYTKVIVILQEGS